MSRTHEKDEAVRRRLEEAAGLAPTPAPTSPVPMALHRMVVGHAEDQAERDADQHAAAALARLATGGPGPTAHQHGPGCEHVRRTALPGGVIRRDPTVTADATTATAATDAGTTPAVPATPTFSDESTWSSLPALAAHDAKMTDKHDYKINQKKKMTSTNTESATAREHIWKGHKHGSALPGKGKFKDGTTDDQLDKYIAFVMRCGTPAGTNQWEADLGEPIGVDLAGGVATKVKVVLNGSSIMTAYPL